VLNGDEPRGQFNSDSNPPAEDTESSFVFDELGLYSSGGPAISTSGYQHIDVGNRTSTDDTGLLPGQGYAFDITVDGGTLTTISFTTPIAGGSGAGGQILYGDLCQAVNTGDVDWGFSGVNPLPGGSTMSITDASGGLFPSIGGAQTYGFIRVQSSSSGATSSISLAGSNTTALLAELNPPLGADLETAVTGTIAGLQNNPIVPTQERERLLAHLIFSPILKARNRTLTISYTLTVSVARTPGVA
jgi:hypothetical protein